MDPIENMQQASRVVEGLLVGVQADQMSGETSCAKWQVSDLVAHVVNGANMFGSARLGVDMVEMDELTADNAAAQYRQLADRAIEAFSAEGALESTVQMPMGEMPGAMVASLLFADNLTHAWDIARATGQELDVDNALAEQALGVWQMGLQPAYRDGDMFGDEQQAGDAASMMDRVAAFTGRQI